MSTYVIGDIHGCIHTLDALLKRIGFDERRDALVAAGDMCNKGKHSFEVLQRLASLGAQSVIGNNDFLAGMAVYGQGHKNALKVFGNEEKLQWAANYLAALPLLFASQDQNGKEFVVVHAGIPPNYSIEEATIHAHKAEEAMAQRGDFWRYFLGNQSHISSQAQAQICYTVNALTRMRLCSKEGVLDFASTKADKMMSMKPWFAWRSEQQVPIIFGHWARLEGRTHRKDIVGLDYGCVYGRSLCAYHVEAGAKIFEEKHVKD